MTNKEVIDFLKSEKEATRKLASTCNSDRIDYFTKHEEAYDIAIKSLEAWEKVKDEIKQKSDFTKNIWDEYPDEWYAGKCSAYHESLEIIDKYLAEVSE